MNNDSTNNEFGKNNESINEPISNSDLIFSSKPEDECQRNTPEWFQSEWKLLNKPVIKSEGTPIIMKLVGNNVGSDNAKMYNFFEENQENNAGASMGGRKDRGKVIILM